MLPPNIDLTERRDFGRQFSIDELGLDISFIVEGFYDDTHMTNEEYDKLKMYERFFGRKRHTNERRDLFELNYIPKNFRETCIRCGKTIRIPWKNYHCLCKECAEHNNPKIPLNDINLHSEMTSYMDIFVLK